MSAVLDRSDQRVLGAVRFVDAATGLWIEDYLTVDAPDVKLLRNAHGAVVIVDAPGFADYTAAFVAPPSTPPIGSQSVMLTVSDPRERYLPRTVTLKVPRDPDRSHPDSLFDIVEAPLYPAPAGPIAPGAAIVRASVRAAGGGAGLAAALIVVARKSDGVTLARGLSDGRGEALVTVPGVPVMSWDGSGGSVLAPETVVTATAYYDPALAAPPDPEALEARRASLKSASAELKLASRREQAVTLEITL